MNTSKSILFALLLLSAGVTCAQQRTKGVVRWDDDKPAPGALVTVKGTTNTTMTDADGEYEIQTNPGDVLEIIVPYYKIYYTYSAHRLNVWADAGISAPGSESLRQYRISTGNDEYYRRERILFGGDNVTGAYSLPGAGIGVGYEYIRGNFLLSVGLELRSLNSYRCYEINQQTSNGTDAYKLSNFTIHNRIENHLYAQVPVMMGFELPHFYWKWGMKVGTSLYNGNMINGDKYDWQCIRWVPTTEIGITLGKGPSVPVAQKAQKGKAEYPGRAIVYKIGLVFDAGFNHIASAGTRSDGSRYYYYPFATGELYLGAKFTASLQSEMRRKERRWR